MREVQTVPSRCDHSGCIAPVQKDIGTCSNSCCSGEGAYCEEHNLSHRAQGMMDSAGCASGYFGDQHGVVVEMVVRIWKEWSEALDEPT